MAVDRYSRPGWLSKAPLVALALCSAAVYAAGFRLAPDWLPTRFFPILHAPLLLGWLAAITWVWRRPGASVPLIVGFALAFRLLSTLDPPALSSDCHRYAWDGRVQRAGISPYAHAPSAGALSGLRDAEIWPRINRPDERTVYPPGAQVLYLALPFSVDGLRWVMIAFDLATILLIARLLAAAGLDPARVVLYAWSPLVVYEVGNNGHVEAAMLTFLVGAALAHRSGRLAGAGALVGVAASMKLYPLLALAALGRRAWLPAAAVVGGLYAIYAAPVGSRVLGFLPRYFGSAEDHNIGLRRWLEALLPVPHAREVAFALCVALMLAGLAWVWRRGGPPERVLLGVAGVYLLTLPSAFHPWYALWLAPWLCFHPRLGGLWLLATLPLSYLKYGAPGEVMPAWVVPVEILPAVALLLAEPLRTAPRPSPVLA